jgi:membrane-associated phospholipid phosphatase
MSEPRTAPGIVAGARPRSATAVVGLVLAAFVAVELVILGLGMLVTRVLAHSALHRKEIAFEHDVVVHRMPWWNHVTSFGTVLGGTETVIALTAVGCVVLALRGHGPRLPAFLAVAVAGETTLFLLASIVIHRLRPPIPHLDGAPPTSSFPSGHTAAALCLYGTVAALVLAGARGGWRRWAPVLAVLVVLVVAGARLYRGAHHATDVLTSMLFASAWLLAVLRLLPLPSRRARRVGEWGRD